MSYIHLLLLYFYTILYLYAHPSYYLFQLTFYPSKPYLLCLIYFTKHPTHTHNTYFPLLLHSFNHTLLPSSIPHYTKAESTSFGLGLGVHAISVGGSQGRVNSWRHHELPQGR